MSLEARLAKELIRKHPERAAAALERASVEERVEVLSALDAREAAEVVRRLTPQTSAPLLDALPAARVADLLELLPVGVASRLVRRLAPEQQEAVYAELPARLARGIRAMLRYPENSAASLMDPSVMSLPEDLTAAAALERIRREPDGARYNLYVVDQEQKLVGVVNLRELLIAKPGARLRDFMVPRPRALDARSDRSVVIVHPGWQEVHALPVVDEEGAYLGAVRYRTLRALEQQLLHAARRDGDAREALGDLFAAGAGGLFGALGGSGVVRGGEAR